MRVHFVGNTCNGHFDVVRSLRRIGVDAHLFLPPLLRDPQTAPESVDPSLAGGYPPWIHRMVDPLARLRPLGNVGRRDRARLLDCDVIHCHADYATWIMDGPTPFVIQPFGADFSVLPFGRRFGRSYTRWKDYVPDYRWLGFARQVREAYRRAAAIILSNVDRLWERGYRALLEDQRIAMIGLVMDTEQFSPASAAPTPAAIAALRKDHDLILFQPTRQMWTEPGRRAEGGYSKGNDLFFRGLAGAIAAGVRACAIVVDKGSLCTAASRQLVHDLGLAEHVRWVPGMPRHDLVAYYRHADVAVDAFYAGGFGSAALEAMATGCPVLMHLDREGNRAIYGEDPPVASAASAAEITARIIELAADPGRVDALGRQARDFIERHHARDAVVERYRSLYDAVLGRDGAASFVAPDVFRSLRSPLPPTRAPSPLDLFR
jgi:glycosyltransferase involved in cell wall biosynthesis